MVRCELLELEEGGNSIKACNWSGSDLIRELFTQYPKMLIAVMDETVLLSLRVRLYFFAASLNLATFSSIKVFLLNSADHNIVHVLCSFKIFYFYDLIYCTLKLRYTICNTHRDTFEFIQSSISLGSINPVFCADLRLNVENTE